MMNFMSMITLRALKYSDICKDFGVIKKNVLLYIVLIQIFVKFLNSVNGAYLLSKYLTCCTLLASG